MSQYFRNKYDAALVDYPLISSRVQITRIEVWVTNRQNRVSTTNNNLRNIIALQDLGEGRLAGFDDNLLASRVIPALTTIRRPVRQMAQLATTKMIMSIEQNHKVYKGREVEERRCRWDILSLLYKNLQSPISTNHYSLITT